MRTSVMDLGSNSFHLVVADVDAGRLAPVARKRAMLHLGRTVARHGTLPDDARDAARTVVADLAERARRAGATHRIAVATSALRDAANGAEVVAELSEAAGTPVHVLDVDVEAQLAYHGARAAVPAGEGPLAVLDLGGGSLELAIGHGPQVHTATSVPLGASRLSALVAHDPMTDAEVRDVLSRVDAEVGAWPPLTTSGTGEPPVAVVVGGPVRALARVLDPTRAGNPPAGAPWPLARDALAELRDRLVTSDLATRQAIPGMRRERADHLHVAAIVLVRVLEQLGVEQCLVGGWGLREGLLLTAAETPALAMPPLR